MRELICALAGFVLGVVSVIGVILAGLRDYARHEYEHRKERDY